MPPAPSSPRRFTPEPGYLRIAAVQIDYLPAIDELIEDPLWEMGSDVGRSLLPGGSGVWPDVVQGPFQNLRERLRAQYVKAHTARLIEIVAACRRLGAQAVVLPEYSVPHEVLEPLAAAAADLLIVAGTHLVGVPAQRSGVYERLGASRPAHATAVCPLLHGGKIVRLVPKLSQSAPELSIGLEVGTVWEPIESKDLPEILGTFGVLICLDFLHDGGEL